MELDNNNKQSEKYVRAQKRIKELKWFYNHLLIYIVCSIVLFVLSYKDIFFINIISPKILNNIELIKWINWNLFGTQIFWGIALFFHALSVLKIPFIKRWEEKQIQKYINKLD